VVLKAAVAWGQQIEGRPRARQHGPRLGAGERPPAARPGEQRQRLQRPRPGDADGDDALEERQDLGAVLLQQAAHHETAGRMTEQGDRLAAVVRPGPGRCAAGRPEAAGLAEQPDPIGGDAGLGGHQAQVGHVAPVHGQEQVPAGQPRGVDLPGPVRGPVVPALFQFGPGPRVHRMPNVPVTRTRAVHGDGVGQTGLGQFGPEHDLGHG